jgi:hypothetical protein
MINQLVPIEIIVATETIVMIVAIIAAIEAIEVIEAIAAVAITSAAAELLLPNQNFLPAAKM